MGGWVGGYQSRRVDLDGPRGNREVRGNGANHAITPIYAKCGSRTHTYTQHLIHIARRHNQIPLPRCFYFLFFIFYFYFSTVDADVPVRLFVVCRYLACTYGCTCICMRTHTHTGHRYTRTHKEIGNGFATLFVRASRSPELCDRVSVLAGYKACTRRGALCYGQHPSFFFVLG